MERKLVGHGNSVALVLEKSLLDQMKLTINDYVDVEFTTNKKSIMVKKSVYQEKKEIRIDNILKHYTSMKNTPCASPLINEHVQIDHKNTFRLFSQEYLSIRELIDNYDYEDQQYITFMSTDGDFVFINLELVNTISFLEDYGRIYIKDTDDSEDLEGVFTLMVYFVNGEMASYDIDDITAPVIAQDLYDIQYDGYAPQYIPIMDSDGEYTYIKSSNIKYIVLERCAYSLGTK